MKILLTICLAAAIASSACRSNPKKETPSDFVPVPDQWTSPAQSGPVPSNPWWFSFGDAELAGLVDEALQNNHDLKAASFRLEQALATARIAGSDLYPKVDITGSGLRNKQNFIGLPIPGAGNTVLTSHATSYDLMGAISWEVDLWGRIRSAKKAALADLQAAGEEYEAARLSLAAQTLKTWFQVVETGRQLQFETTTVQNYRETVEKVRSRYERGIRPSIDLRLTLSNLADAMTAMKESEIRYERSKRQLQILLGRYPSAQLKPQSELPILPDRFPVGIPADVLSRRPDVRAAEQKLKAADHRIWEAKAMLLPRISLTAGGGTRSNEMESLLDTTFSVWNLAGNAAQPLFQGGRLLAGIKRAEASSKEALERYVQTVLQAFFEVEIALGNESLLAEMEENAMESSRQANAAWSLAEDRYAKGLSDIISVLEAQRRAVHADRALMQIRRSRLDNRIDLHLALGGSFEGAESFSDSPIESGAGSGLSFMTSQSSQDSALTYSK